MGLVWAAGDGPAIGGNGFTKPKLPFGAATATGGGGATGLMCAGSGGGLCDGGGGGRVAAGAIPL